MSKHNFFIKFLKKANLFIDSLLRKNLNKLNFLFQKDKILDFTRPKRVIVFLIVIFSLILSYLSIPYLYDEEELITKLEKKLSQRFEVDFIFSKNLKYNMLPWPNFSFNDLTIEENDKKIAKVDNLKIYLSSKNFLSSNFKIDNILLDNANFNLNNKNYNFFIDFLDSNFLNSNVEIINSNIFYRNIDNEVLIINKINNLKYYYDTQNLVNSLKADSEIFNIPYTFELQNNNIEKKLYTKINLSLLKLQIEKEFDYSNKEKKGLFNFIHNKNKSEANYRLNKETLKFNFLDKSIDPKFIFKGEINFFPFFLNFIGDTQNINVSTLFNSESILAQFFKTEILNNKNLNIETVINSKKVIPFNNLNDLVAKIKIEEGLIDIDDTKFSWFDYASFQISDSLIYINNNNLVLDGKFVATISDFNEIYKFLQTPRNYRKELKKIEFNFNYNFDQEIFNFSDIKINDQTNQKVSKILNQFISKKSKIENRVHFKNLMNEAIRAYAG